jgi:peptide-methionine (S)-S-oxide reductase
MTEERAVLAGGCFWGMQDLLRRYLGVISTRVGYTGGDVPNATYRHHGNHAEAIEIIFDPQMISYRRLLEFFFQIHDCEIELLHACFATFSVRLGSLQLGRTKWHV